MPQEQEIKDILSHIDKNKPIWDYHTRIFDIYEGNLLHHIEKRLAEEFTPKAYLQIKKRIPPINILTKMVDKLAKIYQQHPARTIIEGDDNDKELLEWYQQKTKHDKKLNISNEFYNMSKSTLIQPYVHNGLPAVRAIPNNCFLPYSTDKIDPLNPTHQIIVNGKVRDKTSSGSYEVKSTYRVYTDSEIYIIDEDEKVREDLMAKMEMDGTNPVGRIPFIYANRSSTKLIPTPDSDLETMTLLIPVLMADLNYAVKFQAFSILYGINVKSDNLEKNPNAFWVFETDAETDRKPEIGSIKPSVDIDQVLGLIQAELAFWLQTKNIRPGTVGQLTESNFATGISKIIDEMDTSDERQKQVSEFLDVEDEYWDLVRYHMHPYWAGKKLISNTAQFTADRKVDVTFAPQLPLTNRGEVVNTKRTEVEAGFTTRKRAIKDLNPKMSEEEVEALIIEIDEENMVAVPIDQPEDPDADPDIQPVAPLEGVEEVPDALNGAQVTSMVEVITSVAQGLLPAESAIGILMRAFGLSEEEARKLVEPAASQSFNPPSQGQPNGGTTES